MALSDHVATLDALGRAGKRAAPAILAQLQALIARGKAVAASFDRQERGRTQLLDIARATVTQLAADLDAFFTAYVGDLDLPAELWLDVRAAQTMLYRLLRYERGWASASGLTAGATSDAAAQLDARRLVPYMVREGDTLERIALATLGSAERAWELIDLNGLQYPFLRTERPFREPSYAPGDYDAEAYETTPSPDLAEATVRVPGETLWLPPDGTIPEDLGSWTDQDVALFGRDFELRDGFLSITSEGRLRLLEGRNNLVAALLRRIATAQGELVLHPSYGIERLLAVGVEGTPAHVRLSGLMLARSIADDPRVTAVRDLAIRFADGVDQVAVTVAVIGPAQRDVALNLIIPDAG